MKEKEEHIDQLLKERDLERGEVAKAAAQADELEDKLFTLQQEHQRVVSEAEEEICELKRLNQEYEEVMLPLNFQFIFKPLILLFFLNFEIQKLI